MTRIIELQARLALEAANGRAADVSSHPIFHEVMAIVVGSLAKYPDAAREVVSAIRERLGLDVPLTVNATVEASASDDSQRVPFPEG